MTSHAKRLLSAITFGAVLLIGMSSAVWATPPNGTVPRPLIDPSYNNTIISNFVFTNINTMGVGDIQNFLNSKVPTCDSFHQINNTAPPTAYICLKNYLDPSADNKNAAQIIYDEARRVKINPQVLLVMLEKERSLITSTWPFPSDYTSAMNYACGDVPATCQAQYQGFYNQVRLTANLLRAGFDQTCNNTSAFATSPPNPPAIPTQWAPGHLPTPVIDGRNTVINNCATSAVYNYEDYNYSPTHRPDSAYASVGGRYYYGTYDFVTLFYAWFGNTQPPANLIVQSNSTGALYYVTGNQRFHLPSMDTYLAFNFQRLPIFQIDAFQINALTDSGELTTLVRRDSGDSSPLLVDSGKYYKISNTNCANWGLNCGNAQTLPAALIDGLANSGNLTGYLWNQGGVYKMEAGNRRPVLNSATLEALGGANQVLPMQKINASQPVGTAMILNGSVLRFSNGQIFLFDDNVLHAVPSIAEFLGWGMYRFGVSSVPDSYLNGLTQGGNISNFVQDGNGTKWLIDLGNKRALSGQEQHWPIGNHLTGYGLTTLAKLPVVQLSPYYRSERGAIFGIYNGLRYPFMSPDDFITLGCNPNQILPVSNYVEDLFGYGGLQLAPGRIFKVAGGANIVLVTGWTSLHIPSPNYFYYYQLNASRVLVLDVETAGRYPATGDLSPVFRSSWGQLFLANNFRFLVTTSMQIAYLMPPTAAIPLLPDSITVPLIQGPNLTAYARDNQGGIWLISGGVRRQFMTMDALYRTVGGNRIIPVPNELLQTLPIGEQYF